LEEETSVWKKLRIKWLDKVAEKISDRIDVLYDTYKTYDTNKLDQLSGGAKSELDRKLAKVRASIAQLRAEQ
jgi:hypothetical protein